MRDLDNYEQFRYDMILRAIDIYCHPSVKRKTIEELDELISSLLEEQ